MQSNPSEVNNAEPSMVVSSGHALVDVACLLQSHDDCDQQYCEIARVGHAIANVSEKQLRIAEATAITGLAISSLFDLALIVVWLHHAWSGATMPEVPWFIISIATATHAAGGVSAFKIARKE